MEEQDKRALLFEEENTITDFIQIYVPNKDREDVEIPSNIHEKWVLRFKQLLMDINGGTTTTYTEGTWVEENEKDGKLERRHIFEKTFLIKSFIVNEDVYKLRKHEIANLVLRFGKDTNQGAVAVETRDSFQLVENYEQG